MKRFNIALPAPNTLAAYMQPVELLPSHFLDDLARAKSVSTLLATITRPKSSRTISSGSLFAFIPCSH
jgi:hypothetical protein